MVAWEAEITWCDEHGDIQAEGRVDEVLQPESIRRTNDGYGLTRRPPGGTVIHVIETEGGDIIVVGEEPESRPELTTEGETWLWDYDGNRIELVPGSHARMRSRQGNQIKLDDDALLDADNAILETSDLVYVGSASATDYLLKATDLINDMNVFLTSWLAKLLPVEGAIDPILGTYARALKADIGILKGQLTGWKSQHRIDK